MLKKNTWSVGQKKAFYSAYRSSLILAYCSKISSPKKCLLWFDEINNKLISSAKKSDLEKKIDLHNSLFGKELYIKMLPFHHRQFFEPSFFISALVELTEKIKIISSWEEVEKDKMAAINSRLF